MKRWIKHILNGFYFWLECKAVDLSHCEVCNEQSVANACIGCGAYICYGCDSMYYEDETLCIPCRSTITPEEEARDRVDSEIESES